MRPRERPRIRPPWPLSRDEAPLDRQPEKRFHSFILSGFSSSFFRCWGAHYNAVALIIIYHLKKMFGGKGGRFLCIMHKPMGKFFNDCHRTLVSKRVSNWKWGLAVVVVLATFQAGRVPLWFGFFQIFECVIFYTIGVGKQHSPPSLHILRVPSVDLHEMTINPHA